MVIGLLTILTYTSLQIVDSEYHGRLRWYWISHTRQQKRRILRTRQVVSVLVEIGSCHFLFSPYSGRWGQQWQGHDFSRAPTCRYHLWRSHTNLFSSSPLVCACVLDLGGLHSSSRTGPFTPIPLFSRARWPHTSSQSADVRSILSYSMPVICVHWSQGIQNLETPLNSCAATCPNLYQALSVYVAMLEMFTFALILPLLFLPCIYLWFLRRATAEAEAFALCDLPIVGPLERRSISSK